MKLRKIAGAMAFLLVCLILLVSASYAWLSMSRAPEIKGIDTQIGSNGSLAIALLSDAAYMDPSLIRALVGDSMEVQDPTISNLTWGNVIDLSDESYGLGQISMLPSRLNVSGSGDHHAVSSNMLSIPNYGLDGRFNNFSTDTVSATFHESRFIYYTEHQSYGVRGIGTISNMTLQQSALAAARSLVQSYTSAASSAAKSAWTANGASILDICYRNYFLGNDNFNDSDVAVLRDTATRMLGALSYIDLALRQGIVGYAASAIDDEEIFKTLRSTVENTAIPLSMVVEMLPTSLPSGFSEWISTVENDKTAMQRVIIGCDAMAGGSYSWREIYPILNGIMAVDQVYLGQNRLSAITVGSILPGDTVLTLSPDAGVLADVADYAGDYSVFFTYSKTTSVEVTTMSTVSPAYLIQVSEVLEDSEAAAGDGSITSAELNDIYGYAIDLAFLCNEESDLLLQTEAEFRVNSNAEGADIQGGGCYMRFASDSLTEEQIVSLMDAIRIGFLDNQSTLLGVAKLNTSNYSSTEESVTAPLYLYDFNVSQDGSISIGERRKEENVVTALPESTAVIITVVVWLDGDHVDNSLATISARSMEGMLNLQFASSAELLSADLSIEVN